MDKKDLHELAIAICDEMDSRYSAELAPKWQGASIMFIPKDSNVKDHEIPINKWLHKVIMVRDNLRVLEQQINSNDKLNDAEKVKFQGYITKCYGSLTSFNFMFYDDKDKF